MRIKIFSLIFLFVFSLILIGQNLDKPFWGEHDWNGVRYGNIARNYLRYGFWETKFGQVENSGWTRVREFEYYTHYPPLLPILIALSFKFFGISEWSTRLVPILTTSGIIVMIYLIGSFVWDIKIGILASLLALATPMVLYFGKNVSHEPVVLFFITLSIYGYLKSKPLFLIGLVLAEMTAWAGYFILPTITISLIFKKDWPGVKRLLPYWILSIALFSMHFVHVAILTGSLSGGNLIGSLLQRSGLLGDVQPSGFNVVGYLDRLRFWFGTVYTITLTILAIGWILIKRVKFDRGDLPILSLGLVGLIYIILFSNSVFIHNYLIFYFLPFLSLAGSFTILHLAKIKFLKQFGLILPLIFLILIFSERRNFLEALNRSQADRLAVEIGQAIKEVTSENEIVLVFPLKYSYSADKFLRFYSDRKLVYSDNITLDHDVLVLVDQDKGKFEIIR